MKIGILAVQGAFREHQNIFNQLGAETVQVRLPEQLEGIDGLAIPGGESTSIGKLMREYNLIDPIQTLAQEGLPVFGTCAGMIVMAKEIEGDNPPHLSLMDVKVNRNSFGRQKDSFETDLAISAIGADPFPAVFIRAPHIVSVGEGVEVLSSYEDRVVAVQEGRFLALSFHPELTGDSRLHQHFLNMVERA
jgi:5'-phosphate synthase pdxT subunit